ncbi:MAG: response regulator transcription factor [Lachnospiraceae bacterium]|nr:response regulator transcription factor [Lachnospiraceae bacterium]
MNDFMKIALVDDSETDRAYLEKLVKESCEKTGEAVRIRSFPSAEAFLFDYEEEKDYALLLLDVEMGKMDGVTLAKKIRAGNPAVQIVFVTGYSDYIADGYEVEALHYLLKPVKDEKLSEVLIRAFKKFRTNERTIALETDGAMELVPLRSIRYLEVFRNYTTVHADREYTVKKTLSEFEAELSDRRFFRLSRSLLVNLFEIRRVSRDCVFLKGGEMLPLPKGKYESLNRALIDTL